MAASLIEFTLVSICPSGYSTSGSTEMSLLDERCIEISGRGQN
jgi:hypothetical protein